MNQKNYAGKKTVSNKKKNMQKPDLGHTDQKRTNSKQSGTKQSNLRQEKQKQKNQVRQNAGSPDLRRSEPKKQKQKPEKKALPCPVYNKCGGCQLLHVDYKKQLKRKKEDVAEFLKEYGRIEGIIGMEKPEHYRHKVHAVFGRDARGNIISGNYKEGTHIIVPVDRCLLENEKADDILRTIRGLLKSFKIKTYDEDTDYGLLRHVLIRVGYKTNQVMVVLVLSSPIMPSKNNFVRALRKEHPEISTVVINVNNQKTSMVLGAKEQVIYGPGYIEDELCGMTFKISPKSFYQVNPEQTEILYQKAIEYAGLSGRETVLDAYCGTGTIGMIASRKAGKVIGVELNQDAVRDAIAGAKRNGLSNVRFYQGDAGEFMEEMADAGEKADVVLLDPPRTGSSEKFLSALVRMAPKKVVYVSCNPETLARDMKYLCGKGYRMEKGVAVDMFPFAKHCECVVLMSRKDK